MNENRSPEAAEAQAEMAAEREHVTRMRALAENRVAAEGRVMDAKADRISAQTFVINVLGLAGVLFSGLGAWYVIGNVL